MTKKMFEHEHCFLGDGLKRMSRVHRLAAVVKAWTSPSRVPCTPGHVLNITDGIVDRASGREIQVRYQDPSRERDKGRILVLVWAGREVSGEIRPSEKVV